MVDVHALRYDLGAAWLNLLGSRGHAYGERPIERLTGPDRLAEFLAHEGLTPVSTRVTDEDVRLARELREALRPLALTAAHGETPDPAPVPGTPPDAAAVAALNGFLAADQPVRLDIGADGLHTAPPADARAALARIAREAAGHLTGPEAAHLRVCADDECSGAYLDPTGRRRWCSTERCGVKARVRAYRARQKAAGQTGP